MADKKVLFFDIDGTIWWYKNFIPDSTREAIRMLKENGHKLFLNSGRARGHIQNPDLLSLGFDGIVSGCGTVIEYDGEFKLKKLVEPKVLARAIETVRHYGMRPILEGVEHLYLDRDEWEGDGYYEKLSADLNGQFRQVRDYWMKWDDVCKFSCDTTDADIEACREALKEDFSFVIHNPYVSEIVPVGHDKATGIDFVLDMLGADRGDSFAFGDSINDKEMIEAAGVGVVMGNGTDELKAIADYVTTHLKEDGIYNACRHYGLI